MIRARSAVRAPAARVVARGETRLVDAEGGEEQPLVGAVHQVHLRHHEGRSAISGPPLRFHRPAHPSLGTTVLQACAPGLFSGSIPSQAWFARSERRLLAACRERDSQPPVSWLASHRLTAAFRCAQVPTGVGSGVMESMHETIHRLDVCLLTIRTVLDMWPLVPALERQATLGEAEKRVVEAVQAASRAGQTTMARSLLLAAAARPPSVELPELTWSSLIEAGLAAL